MDESKISVRYSKALFELADERGVSGALEKDMRLLLEVSQTPGFTAFTENPVVLPSVKRTILRNTFTGSVNPLFLDYLDLLVKNGRESHVVSIARYYVSLSLKRRGITEASVTTAVELSGEIENRLIRAVTEAFRTEVLINKTIDKNIIGGFIVMIEDRLLDKSVRTALKKVGDAFEL